MQLNAPFGKIILICSQRMTRRTNHQVCKIPLCPVTTRLVLMSHVPLSSLMAAYDQLKQYLSYQNSEGGSPSYLGGVTGSWCTGWSPRGVCSGKRVLRLCWLVCLYCPCSWEVKSQ